MSDQAQTYSVFLENPVHANHKRVAQAVAGLSGVTVIDVRKYLRDCCGVVAEKLDERKAFALGEFLNKQGFPAVVLSDADVLRFPPPILVNSGRRTSDGIALRCGERVDETPAGTWIEAKWDDLIYLAWARVREQERYRTSEVKHGGAAFGGAAIGYVGMGPLGAAAGAAGALAAGGVAA